MGKRSNFERIERDFYPTPPEAVTPLVPHLVEGWNYWEPCAGDGALVKAMPNWFPCGACSDIDPRGLEGWMQQRDALEVSERELWHIDCIITNPPWSRAVLHPMIEHFSAMRPTWLLFDADWMHTKQSAPFMPWLRKVVSVGRVKWIPGSPHTGKDNCAWYLFDQNAKGPTEFVGRTPQSPARGDNRAMSLPVETTPASLTASGAFPGGEA